MDSYVAWKSFFYGSMLVTKAASFFVCAVLEVFMLDAFKNKEMILLWPTFCDVIPQSS